MSPTSYQTALSRVKGEENFSGKKYIPTEIQMDGVEGFEPPNDWTKTSCLTAWPYPNRVYPVYVDGIIAAKILDVKCLV